MTGLILFGLALLAAVYMTHPRFRRFRISSARFFTALPQPKKRQPRLRFGKIQLTLPFFLQLGVLLCILAAVWLSGRTFTLPVSQGMGVWVVLDTSASMSTIQDGSPRLETAVKEAEQVLNRAQDPVKKGPVCFRFSTFDMERRDFVVSGNADTVRRALTGLKPREMGTDLAIIRQTLSSTGRGTPSSPSCNVSHVVIISDLPAPSWIKEKFSIEIIWLDIGKPVNNTGLVVFKPLKNPLNRSVTDVQVEIAAYGSPPANALFQVFEPGGKPFVKQPLNFQTGKTVYAHFKPSSPGVYRMQVSPGGAYGFDDSASLPVSPSKTIRVDWQLPDREIPGQLGWTLDSLKPDLRVMPGPVPGPVSVPVSTASNPVPVLLVGSGYVEDTGKPSVIRDFIESSPLLRDVNLDVVETLALKDGGMPEGWKLQPVLRTVDNAIWLAQSKKPLCAYVAGLPTGKDDLQGRFSATVFFNALRWLLEQEGFEPGNQNRWMLYKDEGNTERIPLSSGSLDRLRPGTAAANKIELWPFLLLVASILFLIERTVLK